MGKTLILADCWGLAHCILDVGTWHYGDNMSGCLGSASAQQQTLPQRKKSLRRKNIFLSRITFSSYPLKSLCILWKEYFSFSFDQTILFLCSPFVKVHLTNYHLSAGLREWDYPWHIHKTCPKENKKANICFAFGLFLTNFLISKAERIVQ